MYQFTVIAHNSVPYGFASTNCMQYLASQVLLWVLIPSSWGAGGGFFSPCRERRQRSPRAQMASPRRAEDAPHVWPLASLGPCRRRVRRDASPRQLATQLWKNAYCDLLVAALETTNMLSPPSGFAMTNVTLALAMEAQSMPPVV